MGGVVKAIKKVVKGVGKVVKKVVKSVTKVVKKVVSAVGDLGIVGSIALSFIAPYAIGALASSATGWVSAIGKGLQAIGSVVTAPAKFLGQAAGSLLGNAASGLSSFAADMGLETISSGLSSISEKLFTGMGGGATSVGEAFNNVVSDVSSSFSAASDAFSTAFNGVAPGDTLTTYGTPETAGSMMPEGDDIFNPAEMTGADQVQEGLMGNVNTEALGTDAFNHEMLGTATNEAAYETMYDDNLMGSLSAEGMPASPEMIGFEGDPNKAGALAFKEYTAQDLSGLNTGLDQPKAEESSILDKLGDGLKGAFSGSSPTSYGNIGQVSPEGSYAPITQEGADGRGKDATAYGFLVRDAQGNAIDATGATGLQQGQGLASLLALNVDNPGYQHRWAQ